VLHNLLVGAAFQDQRLDNLVCARVKRLMHPLNVRDTRPDTAPTHFGILRCFHPRSRTLSTPPNLVLALRHKLATNSTFLSRIFFNPFRGSFARLCGTLIIARSLAAWKPHLVTPGCVIN
jgi:hypothetical protein